MNPEQDDDVSSELTGAFLNRADFEDGAAKVFTIAEVTKKTFDAKNGKPADTRRVLTFHGGKMLSLNRTNLKLMAKWYGPKTSAWINQPIAVYRDESVFFAGQLTGGWRIRKPSKHDQVVSPDVELDNDVALF